MTGLEPATPSSRTKCATTALHPESFSKLAVTCDSTSHFETELTVFEFSRIKTVHELEEKTADLGGIRTHQ